MTSAALTIQEVSHRFGPVLALDQVDLTVETGDIYGFLGRNGAGKTTLIRAVLGLLMPAAGRITVLGTPVRGGRTPSALWRQIGYLVEGPGLYPSLTVAEHLGIAADYHGLSPTSITATVERLDLGRYRDVPARALSLGNRQRLGLALALIHAPSLLILDEPVNGLDPAGVADVRTMLRDLADDGVTVFMSTHLITELARLADRVGIIDDGRLVEELSGPRLLDSGPARLVSSFRTPQMARRAVAALRDRGIDARADGDEVVSGAERAVLHPDAVATHLVQAGAPPTSLAIVHDDLEEYFLRLTDRSTR